MQFQLAEERETKGICIIYSRETICEPSVLSHHHSHQIQSFLYYTLALFLWVPHPLVLAQEPEVQRFPEYRDLES